LNHRLFTIVARGVKKGRIFFDAARPINGAEQWPSRLLGHTPGLPTTMVANWLNDYNYDADLIY
jgi:hypothetical protein